MFDITNYLPGKRKSTPSGWISFNAPCCQYNGQSPDRRGRGGLKASEQGWSFHCFNCGYTASFILGKTLSFKARRLLGWFNVPENEIEHINLESIRHRNINGLLEDRRRADNQSKIIDFEERELPPFAELLTQEVSKEYWNYVRKRFVPVDFPIMVQMYNDGTQTRRPHVIVPFTHNNKIVGHTSRFLDDRQPKFISDAQPGYVFGCDLLKTNWQYAIVTEGIFDALSIGGLAVMHQEISDQQVRLIRSMEREVIVVPDQDKSGLGLIDRAVELGWAVSVPNWAPGIKDVNDAVVKYGRLATVLSILENKETSRIKIELKKKHLIKKFT
jgi:hypothetical protein